MSKLTFLNVHATTLQDVISWDGATELLITFYLNRTELEQHKEESLNVLYFCNSNQEIKGAVKEVAWYIIIFILLNSITYDPIIIVFIFR